MSNQEESTEHRLSKVTTVHENGNGDTDSLTPCSTPETGRITRTSQSASQGNESTDWSSKSKTQVLAALFASMGFAGTGSGLGFSSIATPQLLDPQSYLQLTEEQISWFASILTVGYIAGSILGGYMSSKLGRRRSIMINCIPYVLGWVVIATARSITVLYLGRMVTGICIGVGAPNVQVYISEVTEPEIRGSLGSLTTLLTSVGIVLVYLLGSFLSWDITAALLALIPFSLYFLMSAMPETPYWLVVHGETNKATENLKWLRNENYDSAKEMEDIVKSYKSLAEHNYSTFETAKRFIKPHVRRPFLIVIVLLMVQNFSGVFAITYFAVPIFQMSGGVFNENASAIIVGIVRLIGTGIAVLLLHRIGRRPLCNVSGAVMSVSLFTMGTFFYFKEGYDKETIDSIDWIPLFCLTVFMIAYSFGFGPVPWILLGEILPLEVRGIASGICVCLAQVFNFIVIKSFYDLLHGVRACGTFWIYGTVCAMGTVYSLMFVPETKDKTLHDIEQYFSERVK